MSCKPLEQILKDRIAEHGPIPFGDFMALALGHPEHGYYVQGDPLGAAGDFTTAPEISQMFGEMLGAWVADVWVQMGQPDVHLVECGPGRGTLMADILRACRAVPGFAQAADVVLVEMPGVLRDRQRDALASYPNVRWCDRLSDDIVDKPSIILGNEFLDALPVEQCLYDDSVWVQRAVSVREDGKGFCFEMIPADPALLDFLPKTPASGEIYEVSPARAGFIESCGRILDKHGGVALFIDYGHAVSHYGDTVQALRRHAYSSVLSDIGASDITAHVDFDTLCRVAARTGMMCRPVVPQGRFLMHLGIVQRAQVLAAQNPEKEVDIRRDMDRLIDEHDMGTLFKVFCFHKGGSLQPCGFE